ncbi:MAG: hypothetical protein R8N23_19125 [Reichenbachiella sp.]|uniref:hypothetical protein n=1 Tax=Reichenbachiella sp. TaxID=2184521 RepID=UPI002966FD5C|nr:hypothetical protein [Reichenbachiella sp.]MDW3211990.1 hypothetical protein [Reichenbachiella sp.]
MAEIKDNSNFKIPVSWKILGLASLVQCLPVSSQGQHSTQRNPQLEETLTPFRLPLPQQDKVEYLYGKKKTITGIKAELENGMGILWLDDDGDLQEGDLEGDLDNDCLLVDLNMDGKYGDEGDLIVDYVDADEDGKADYQVIIENAARDYTGKWKSHYMWFVDNDNDGVFGYMNWDTFRYEGWDHSGKANFFADYHGQSTMLKVHISPWNIDDLSFNWENPFLFYDHDDDGLTEMAIRVVDEPVAIEKPADLITWSFSQKASLVQMTFDLDNDNAAGNELDFDMSLKFSGPGFDYSDQVQPIQSHPIAKKSDKYFADPRWRHLDRLVYVNHDSAYDLTFSRGEWNTCWLVFDEDDDCHRWERVEFYEPREPFLIGAGKGGLDHNPQADPSGDRGEWDQDFSGKGNLYVSPLDGKIHLFGAENGYWRIDQNTLSYQGWQGWRGPNIQPEDTDQYEPIRFATIRYEDTDDNGFFDEMSFDMDGDQAYEQVISLQDLGHSDTATVFETAAMKYEDYTVLFENVASSQMQHASEMMLLAEKENLSTEWYNHYKKPRSIREQYHNGFWLSYYIFQDLIRKNSKNEDQLALIRKAYLY